MPDESEADSVAEEIPATNEIRSAQVDDELKDAAQDEYNEEEEDEDDEDAEVSVLGALVSEMTTDQTTQLRG